MAIDYELYPYAEKSRRLFVELLELIIVSVTTFLLFAIATSNIIKAIPSYQVAETQRVESRDELYSIGKESRLVVMADEKNALGSYEMFIRFSYKCIHRSFEMYEEDFKKEGFNSIADNYRMPSISKDNDELLYFYTVYGPTKGLIQTDNPLDNYRNNILDLNKHNNIMIYNDELECFILNPQTPNGSTTINFAVALYKELYDDNKNTAMNAMHKLYVEYYDKANDILESSALYKTTYMRYEESSLTTSRFISFGMIITYLLVAMPYFLIMPIIKKQGVTPMRLFAHLELTDPDGNHLALYKRIIYYSIKVFVSFFAIFIAFYIGYGKTIFLSPFGVIGGLAVSPIYLVALTGIIWLTLGLLSFLPIFNEQKTTPFEYVLKIRTADRRMDFEETKDYKKRKVKEKHHEEV